MKSKRPVFLIAALLVIILLAACQPQTVEVTRVVAEEVTRVVTETVVEEGQQVEVTRVVTEQVEVTRQVEPQEETSDLVTYDAYSTTDIPTLDPQTAEDVISINYIENLFVQLTNYELETAEIVPEAATDWEVSDDGLTYTFNIRTDIPWVNHNPITGETTQVNRPILDEEGNVTEEVPGFVTANDFVYGIKRACDPNIGSYYSSVIAPLISGCNEVLTSEDPANIPQEMIDAIGVSAPDESTLVIQLAFPASYFLSMTPMWTLTATPEWAIVDNGEQWIEAGNIVSSGRYVLDEWVHGVRRSILRNGMIPEDLHGAGNIDRVVANVVPDISTGYALWLNNEVDISALPNAEVAAHLEEFADETLQVPTLSVFYIAFRTTKPPFDDARVRRAFGAAFDRATFVDVVIQGQGLPMKHFAPPGIFGAPPIDEVGVGFDPEFARQQLADAGYPDCEGFPTVTLLGYSGQNTLDWIEYAQGQWEENLGCSSDVIQVEQQSFAELLDATAADAPDAEVPHMWTLGWGPDYADENNWVGDVLWCESDNRSKRACTELDDLIVEARLEQDADARTELYRQIEEGFFGPEGETPFFPIYLQIQYQATHSWMNQIPALFGGQQWYNWTIDQEAKQAAQP
ncbi:MAG TPA: peptide ABC transporter substrate-binding protein [Candidatus Binatia bacterium]|nr:peptide ABC transporter substrate-binding protein [Candidatus Binatia bacterium]